MNARSLIRNLDKFKFLLGRLQKPFSVIAISETRLSDLSADQVNIPGYTFISNHRATKSGGGTGLYLQDNLDYKICSDCNISDADVIESLFVEILVPRGKNIIVGVIYRPPNHHLTDFLSKISRSDKCCYLTGDFNLDLLRYPDHEPTQEFVDCLFSHMFVPLINRPTRITAHSATLIDNIFTNHFTPRFLKGIVISDISDHLPVFAYVSDDSLTHDHKRIGNRPMRNFSAANLNNFKTRLSQVNWTALLNDNEPNDSYNIFLSEYSRLYNLCFPLKSLKVKNCKRLNSPWITKSLLISVRKKNKLYRQLLRSPTPTRELQYKSYRNKLNHLTRIAKRHYYDQRFASAKNDLKETWKLINEVINKRKCKPSFPPSFRSDGSIITDPAEIANGFCNYFTNVGPKLAAKIPPVNTSFQSFLNDQTNEFLTLKPTTVEELNGICTSMKSGKAPGYDDISMYVIKNTFELVSEPLKDIINLSFSKGIFPDKLKVAKVIPVVKADEPDLFTNYRPISLLPNFSKRSCTID